MLTGTGIQITEDVTRKAKNTRQELRKAITFYSFYFFLKFVNRKFSREIKIADPSAEVKMEYDNLKVKSTFMHKKQNTILIVKIFRSMDVSTLGVMRPMLLWT